MKRLFIFILWFLIYPVHAETLYPFPTVQQQSQFEHLLKELRCLVCQNQDLSDSNASLAQDLKKQIYSMVNNGQSDSEIINYLTVRYGDFILFKPPVKSLTLLLWYGPGLFLILGGIIFWRTCIKRKIP